ncbi:hypothetical protein SteCoe_36225 [Stentor coeruleus]|uniref:G domain-containing protein n=1 Tax=Stentor coeruleus TaxID=5963 RepID=A0A1R2AQK7_9CILI|nr:hypothetical protein SteCoe_36225 [Stentor coeruleus]
MFNSTFARVVSEDEIGHFDYSILIIGSSGAGKSTLINTAVNLTFESDVKNLKVASKSSKYPNLSPGFDDGKAEMIYHQSQSFTMCSHFYKISCSETNYKTILLVDTPGISSTGGIQDDNGNTLEIMRAARLVSGFNAIFLVQRISDNKLTPHVKYSLYRISEVIPSLFEKSIILFVSYSTDKTPPIDEAEYGFPIKKTFYFNNSFFNFTQADYMTNKKLEKKQNKKLIKSKKRFCKLLSYVFKMNSEASTQYSELFIHHNSIMEKISEYNAHLENLQNLNQYRKYKKEIKITQWINTDYHSTICSKHNTLCHESCSLNFNNLTGTQFFNNCACMNMEKKCKTCGCFSEQHAHRRQKPVLRSLTITEILKYYSIPSYLKDDTIIDAIIKEKENEIIENLRRQEIIIKNVNPRYEISTLLSTCVNVLSLPINLEEKKRYESLLKSYRDK